MIDIFECQNYREYLKAYYEEQKTIKKNFSYRSFSEKAGISASSYLFYVIKGERNMTMGTIMKISAAIGHSLEEAEYFKNLVFFNQATTISEKTWFYSQIIDSRRTIDVKQIGHERYDYYSKWYHSVIREVVTFFDFQENYVKLGFFLVPPITPEQATESVALLQKLGFIERDSEGRYHQIDSTIGTKPSGADVFVIGKFQNDMLALAIKSIDQMNLKKHMSATTTFSISDATFELFKMKTREFRKELAKIARLDNSPERAYQFTFNLFPVSRGINDSCQ